MDIANRIKEYIFENRDRFLKYCRTLVEFETPSNEPEKIPPAFNFLEERFNKFNYEILHVPGEETAGCLYARPSSNRSHEKHQLLLGHVDTVWASGTLDERPFEIDGDRARGPGVFDMKSGLTQIIMALECLWELELEPAMTPIVLVNSDEEIGSPESTRTIKRLAKAVDRTIVLEPSLSPGGAIKTARKGLGHFTITIEGKASHAGLSPEKGQSAIVELSHVIQKLN
jgi:glutamate carboxypeptidase